MGRAFDRSIPEMDERIREKRVTNAGTCHVVLFRPGFLGVEAHPIFLWIRTPRAPPQRNARSGQVKKLQDGSLVGNELECAMLRRMKDICQSEARQLTIVVFFFAFFFLGGGRSVWRG